MKIAFISTRGIPNNYGGFEQFAEHISVGLAQRGHEVTVYSPHYHPYQDGMYYGVRIKHIYSPEKWLGGSVGSFFYDYACLRDALRKDDFDIVYEAGYTSIIPAYIRFNVKNIRRPVFTTNMDGLEYRRTKFNKWVQRFVLWEEKMAVRHSHYLIADNMGIRDYYKEKYGRDSKYLAYGADINDNYREDHIRKYGLTKDSYLLVIARLEPENNIYLAIEGYLTSDLYGKMPLTIVGKTDTPYGRYLVEHYSRYKSIRFVGGIYDSEVLNSIRYYSYLYFHGHSVGGTNPSLLEAMASECFILSHDNVFNRSVLSDNAVYYQSSDDVMLLLNEIETIRKEHREDYVRNNLEVIRNHYSWDKLIEEHEKYFLWMLEDAKKEK